jgi:hypothetical protein
VRLGFLLQPEKLRVALWPPILRGRSNESETCFQNINQDVQTSSVNFKSAFSSKWSRCSWRSVVCSPTGFVFMNMAARSCMTHFVLQPSFQPLLTEILPQKPSTSERCL